MRASEESGGSKGTCKTALRWVLHAGIVLLLSGCAAHGGTGQAVLPPPPPTIPVMTAAAHQAALHDAQLLAAGRLLREHDVANALRLLQAAGEAGNPLAYDVLGQIHAYGDGVPADLPMAATQFRLAALGGDATAAARLGEFYEKGRGVARDQDRAHAWFRLAAEQGEDSATTVLAMAMLTGDGLPRDIDGAIKLLLHCAVPDKDSTAYHPSGEAGGPGCQAALGAIYESGEVVPIDLPQAVKWYSLAAQRNMPVAEKRLGIMYQQGKGVPQDSATAQKWFDRAAADANKGPGSWTPL
jgi:TPR repeat protein